MRVDLRSYGLDAPDKSKPERAPQTSASHVRQAEREESHKTRLSFDHARLQRLHAEAMTQPEVREQRVELLRQALGKGEYAVSESQIAGALLNEIAGARVG